MKKITLMLIALFISNIVFSQSSGVGHSAVSGNYLGWDNSSNQSLQIVHENNWPIEFHTSGGVGSGGIWNNMRMSIFEGTMVAPDGSNHNVGRIGIRENQTSWNFFPTPVSLLHIGQGWSSGVGGHRVWMDVGTFTTAGTDLTYFGLKQQYFGGEG